MTKRQLEKREWLNVYQMQSQRRFDQFRPYHILRNRKSRLGEYEFRHCRQSVRDSKLVDGFFHAQKMRGAGYIWSRNFKRWVAPYKPAAAATPS